MKYAVTSGSSVGKCDRLSELITLHWLVECKVISLVFFTLGQLVRSHHSTAFSIHSIIYIGHSAPAVSLSLILYSSLRITALFGVHHLTCGTNFLLLFMFLTSLVHHHHPTLLELWSWTATSMMAFPLSSVRPVFLKVFHFVATDFILRPISSILTSWCLEVTGGSSVGECDRLIQLSLYFLTYLGKIGPVWSVHSVEP